MNRGKLRSCIGKKDVTLIKTDSQEGDEVCVFEGFMDYLTSRQINDGDNLDNEFLILNSTSMFFFHTKTIEQVR